MKKCSKCKKNKNEIDFRKYKSQCKECEKENCHKYYLKNREKEKLRAKKYRLDNKEKILLKEKEYRETHKEIIKIRRKRYFDNNKEKTNKKLRIKLKKDIQFKLRKNLRNRLNSALQGNYKKGSAVRDLGCSIEFLKQYLEERFYDNPETGEKMTWENYGCKGWHIDHIKPICNFDLTDRKQLLEAIHYTNLQPLWAEENFTKGKKIKI